MGADMILSILPKCNYSDGRKATLFDIVNDTTDDEFKDMNALHAETVDDCKKELKARIEEYFDLPGRRDVCELYLEGTYWLVSGGLSWGDLPTDAMETMTPLEEFGSIWEQLEIWSKKDYGDG